MKKTFLAFYDVLFISVISACLYTMALWIMPWGPLGALDWYWVIMFSVCIAVPTGAILFGIHRCTIDLAHDRVELVYLVNHNRNSRDLLSNWVIYPSEIEKITTVKLSRDEKRMHTSAKFLFSKYLKIEMRHGYTKYVYISHYAPFQINKIIHMLTFGKRFRT